MERMPNDLVAVYGNYFSAALIWVTTGVTGTATVKSKGANGANSLGLYDMSGNIYEWCFDWVTAGTTRLIRGGSWERRVFDLQVGEVAADSPFFKFNHRGFRFAKGE